MVCLPWNGIDDEISERLLETDDEGVILFIDDKELLYVTSFSVDVYYPDIGLNDIRMEGYVFDNVSIPINKRARYRLRTYEEVGETDTYETKWIDISGKISEVTYNTQDWTSNHLNGAKRVSLTLIVDK